MLRSALLLLASSHAAASCITNDWIYEGAGPAFPTATAELCQAACKNDANCQYFTFYGDKEGSCWKFDGSVADTFRATDAKYKAQSGPGVCQTNPTNPTEPTAAPTTVAGTTLVNAPTTSIEGSSFESSPGSGSSASSAGSLASLDSGSSASSASSESGSLASLDSSSPGSSIPTWLLLLALLGCLLAAAAAAAMAGGGKKKKKKKKGKKNKPSSDVSAPLVTEVQAQPQYVEVVQPAAAPVFAQPVQTMSSVAPAAPVMYAAQPAPTLVQQAPMAMAAPVATVTAPAPVAGFSGFSPAPMPFR